MAHRASIRDLKSRGLGWRNELERVASDVDVRDLLLDFGHVAPDALASGAPGFVMGVSFNGGRVRPVRRIRPMTLQTHHVGRFEQVGVVLSAVDVMTTETTDAVGIHCALNKVIPLHPVLVSRSIGEVGEALLPELVLLQLPEILQVHPDVKPTGQS